MQTVKLTRNDAAPVSVVILAHNEVEVIETVVNDFYREVVLKNPSSELIVAEDGSTDGTKEILAEMQKTMTQLRWVEGKERRGYVEAFKEALLLPVNEIILYCDASGKHSASDFWKMEPFIDNHDMVLGYKESRADPLYRIFIGKVFNLFVRVYFKVPFIDIDCPLRIYKKSAFEIIAKQNWRETALINFELVLRHHFTGFKIKQVPVLHQRRRFGPSRGLPLKKIPRVIHNVLKNFPKLKKDFNNLKQQS